MQRLLILNPRSGSVSPTADEVRTAAESRGIRVHVLADGEDLTAVVRDAEADVIGMAGGDGSLAAVAAVAIERGLPFVCIPFGTRNHFARDLGLDRDDPIGALAAFDGEERHVDVGRVGERLFLNNVSLGLYARLVHRRERHRRRRELLARLRALLLVAKEHRRKERFTVDGEPVAARVVLVACNDYSLDLFSVGERERMDEGPAASLRAARLPARDLGRAELHRAHRRLGECVAARRDRRRARTARDAARVSGRASCATRARAARPTAHLDERARASPPAGSSPDRTSRAR